MFNRVSILAIIIIDKVMACAVCYGAIDDPITDGMNNAILFLICLIGFILASIIGTSVHFYNRAKKFN